MKPRVMALVVFTALVGMVLAPAGQHPALAVIALICIAAGAGASGALNMWYDADIDALMQRTAARPIPRGRVTPDEALAFGVVLAVGSVFVLGVLVNWTAGALLALTIAFYLFVYTMWLKRRTPQNIVIGGAAGLVPAHDRLGRHDRLGEPREAGAVPLIFLWTPPHFWALALYRCPRLRARRRADAAGGGRPRRDPQADRDLCGAAGAAGAGAVLPGLRRAVLCAWPRSFSARVFLALSLNVYRVREGREADRAAKQLFAFSILYLFGLFAALLAERSLALWSA